MPERRSYLASDARHEDLLDAAGRLFERGGISAVTMVALAKEAGVSRALVYQHFPDVASLVVDYFERRADAFFSRARAEAGAANPLIGAFHSLVQLADVELRGMNLLLSDYPEPSLAPIRDRVRDRFVARWTDALQPPRDPSATRAAVWAVVQSSVSLAVAVKRGEIDEAVALSIWVGMIAQLPAHLPLA